MIINNFKYIFTQKKKKKTILTNIPTLNCLKGIKNVIIDA